MEIKTSEGHLTITIKTEGIDFDLLMNQIDRIPILFRNHLTMAMGISTPGYYAKKRNKKFGKLEKEAISKITGISIELV